MGSRLSSIQLLSVWATGAHTSCRMRAKRAGWSPVTDAPLLFDRPLASSDPPRRRAHRPMIKLLPLTTDVIESRSTLASG
jgi:hypothetical protein